MHTVRVVVSVVGARGAKPRAFADGREDRCESEEMVASVAVVAKKQLGWGFARVAFLTSLRVVLGDGIGTCVLLRLKEAMRFGM